MTPVKMTKIIFFFFAAVIGSCLFSCSNDSHNDTSETNNTKPAISLPAAPKFNADSAFAFVKAQVDFGPRVPGSLQHAKCADYLTTKLRSFGWDVQVQTASVFTHDIQKMNLKNIIASYNLQNPDRILLLAHWDTRPKADSDTANTDKPADGADDGASGVGVLLEIARQISITKPDVGIDILLDDLEDAGKNNDNGENSWCLGTQHWAKNPHKPGYRAMYGILLDMVGAKNATFPRDSGSREYAGYIVNKVWNKAAHLGYSDYFIFKDVHGITDDHFYINTMANIPCIDIVNMNLITEDFPQHHHRHSDNMSVIDKNTLQAVGQTVLEVVWEEQKPKK